MSLKQELELARKEKKFIQDKLNEVLGTNPDAVREQERVLKLERARTEVAEQGRLQLQAELNLIQQQLDSE